MSIQKTSASANAAFKPQRAHRFFDIEAKNQRSNASYSTNILFDEKEAENLQKKAISFVNKVKGIIDSSSF